jgi:hypothetical protein
MRDVMMIMNSKSEQMGFGSGSTVICLEGQKKLQSYHRNKKNVWDTRESECSMCYVLTGLIHLEHVPHTIWICRTNSHMNSLSDMQNLYSPMHNIVPFQASHNSGGIKFSFTWKQWYHIVLVISYMLKNFLSMIHLIPIIITMFIHNLFVCYWPFMFIIYVSFITYIQHYTWNVCI